MPSTDTARLLRRYRISRNLSILLFLAALITAALGGFTLINVAAVICCFAVMMGFVIMVRHYQKQ